MRAPRSVFFLRKEEGVSLCGGQGAGISKWRVHLLSAVHGGGTTSSSRATSTSRGRPKASPQQVRPASPPSPPTHSLRRVATTTNPDRLAPAAVLTLHRTPHACAGRYLGSSWGQRDYVDARCCCPPLSAHLLPRDASAASRRPPQVPAAFRSGSARMAALLGHPQHPWEGVPTSVCDLSGCVGPERANCPRTPYNPTFTFEDTVQIPFFSTFLKQIERLCT